MSRSRWSYMCSSRGHLLSSSLSSRSEHTAVSLCDYFDFGERGRCNGLKDKDRRSCSDRPLYLFKQVNRQCPHPFTAPPGQNSGGIMLCSTKAFKQYGTERRTCVCSVPTKAEHKTSTIPASTKDPTTLRNSCNHGIGHSVGWGTGTSKALI